MSCAPRHDADRRPGRRLFARATADAQRQRQRLLMSPNPGEAEHESRGWTHAICDADYFARLSERTWASLPRRVLRPGHAGEPFSEACCYCGEPTRGIYVRDAPIEVHGRTRQALS